MITQDTPRVECYRRADQWDLCLYRRGDAVVFDAIDLVISIEEIYEGLTFA